MKLAPDAIIARAKVAGYLLEWRPENDKSHFLGSAGYTVAHADQLVEDIRKRLLPLAGCGKSRSLHRCARWATRAVPRHHAPQDAQKGRPARPQRAKGRIVLLRYGEPLSDARTPLADFFRILLEATFEDTTEYGTKYRISGALVGPNGRQLRVESIWMVEAASGLTKFITLYPTKGV